MNALAPRTTKRRRVAEDAARAHVGKEEGVVRTGDGLERRGGGATRSGATPGSPRSPPDPHGRWSRDRPGRSRAAGRARPAPSRSRTGTAPRGRGRQPASVAAVAVDDHHLVEPGAQAADDLPRQLDQELRLERDGDAEPYVVRAEPRPDRGCDDRVDAGEVAARSATVSTSRESVPTGRCSPCCSSAPTGRTQIAPAFPRSAASTRDSSLRRVPFIVSTSASRR